MPSSLKNVLRRILRTYLTYTPIKRGRFPLMHYAHKFLSESIAVECDTYDRGRMRVELQDEIQYPIYYNNFESKYDYILHSILPGTRVALDVGGNIGQYALLFSRYAQRVYTFEPVPKKIEQLKYNIGLNSFASNVTLVPLALSSRSGTATFALPYDDGNAGTGSLVLDPTWNSSKITVECITMDEFLEREGISDVDLVKMDIEGAELFALQGMVKLLGSEQKPILILELCKPMMTVAGYNASDVQDFLRPYGYEAYDMTKKGLRGPLGHIEHFAENFCFLTQAHLRMNKVRQVLA